MASLTFWGGVGTVTGSKYLIESDRARVLVDCGMFQGLRELKDRNWQDPPFRPEEIDAVLITHAHIDHTGYLPRLVAQGFRGPVYCSRGTADLLKILLTDAARIQEEDADYRNRHNLSNHQPALPLYTEDDARETLKLVQPQANTGEPVQVAQGIKASFRVAGHILGSSLVLVEINGAGQDGKGRRILFSGDLGHYDQPIIKDPEPPPACDYLLCESTYGDRLHDPTDPKIKLAQIINETRERGGVVLIPAFAVGRTQELIYLIRELEDEKKIPILPVRVDSPMAAAATQVYGSHTEEQDAEYASVIAGHQQPLRTHSMVTAASREESKRLNEETGTRIIISASGMMTGGRVLHHAQRYLPDANSTVVFVGYQAAGTIGRRIEDGAREVSIFKHNIPVRCRVERIGGFSAHADWKEVLRWLSTMTAAPRRAFTTHGEPVAAEAMAQHIREAYGWTVEVPQYGERVELD
ncbi:MAG: metallo-beta-lactamase family protein [Acidobacteriota bacterium]|nr:metallo-beta-lactamase family protein [Acidobacteriota bacterium]